MNPSHLLLLSFVLLIGCQPTPQPMNYGQDMCHYCKMTVVDAQHAAQVVTSKGKAYKFDAIECCVNYLNKHTDQQFAHILVNDYENPGVLLAAETSHYLISPAIPSPMGANLSAFASEGAAQAIHQNKGGEMFGWEMLKQHLMKNY